ncbi:MAG: hypothetical protein ACRC2Y_04445 [Aeromonas veronii]
MATKTEKVQGAIELLETEAGVREIFNEMLVGQNGELNLNQKEGLFARLATVWGELVDSKKEADLTEAKAMIEKLKRMGVNVSASDLGLPSGDAPAKGAKPKKEGEAVKLVMWYRDASGAVQTAHVGQKGGMNGEPKEFLAKHGDMKRTEVLVKGENVGFEGIGKHLTKEEFEAAYPA